MSGPKKPLSLEELSRKIDSLRGRKKSQNQEGENESAQSEASRVVSDVVLMPVSALVIGYALDRWFDTTPVLMLVFLGIGVVVGFYNLTKLGKK